MTERSSDSLGTILPDALLRRLNWRYATKKFDASRKIPPEVWAALEKAIVLSPSSFGMQPYKFIVVDDPELRLKLRPVSWDQEQIVQASHLVVFAYRKDVNVSQAAAHIRYISKVRGIPENQLEGYRQRITGFLSRTAPEFDVNVWAARQLYIALGVFLTSAALLGIDTCPIEGLLPEKYDEILDLPAKGLRTVFAAAVGYRAGDDHHASLAKVRYPAAELIAHI
jgi:nitroreductase